jgi:hypothetical protein
MLMRKAFGLVLAGLGALTLTGAAAAASQDFHVMNVPLPDGSIARVEYAGNVAPKVTVTPAPLPMGFPAFGMFDRSMFDMQRRIDAMMRDMNTVATHPLGAVPGMNVADYGNAPAGSTSVTIVSTSNGTQTCTRRTEVTSQGVGKPPKVLSSASGDCGGDAPAAVKLANPA